MSPDEHVKKIKKILDVISLRLPPEEEAVLSNPWSGGASERWFMNNTSPAGIPYNHFPSSMDPSEVNELLSELVTRYRLFEKIDPGRGEVSITFSYGITRKKFDEFREVFTKGVRATEENEKTETKKIARKKEQKFYYFPKTGEAEYKGESAEFLEGTKTHALLDFFFGNADIPFEIGEIQKSCNPKVANTHHWFRSEKDIDDTISQIRRKLKVEKRANFPLHKRAINRKPHWELLLS